MTDEEIKAVLSGWGPKMKTIVDTAEEHKTIFNEKDRAFVLNSFTELIDAGGTSGTNFGAEMVTFLESYLRIPSTEAALIARNNAATALGFSVALRYAELFEDVEDYVRAVILVAYMHLLEQIVSFQGIGSLN